MKDWRKPHGGAILSFMRYLNARTDSLILKGGTALYLCYGLDRFSEDIDLDGRQRGLVELVTGFCEENGYSLRVAKDTDTVQRCMVNYGNAGKPLKIEASFRRREISAEETNCINGIWVYGIESLCALKAAAYAGRDKIRDLYDLAFICNNYFDRLSPQTRSLTRSAVEYKGIEQFDYVVRNQHDELIDPAKLSEDFLAMYDRLGLLYDKAEEQMLKDAVAGECTSRENAPEDEDITNAPFY